MIDPGPGEARAIGRPRLTIRWLMVVLAGLSWLLALFSRDGTMSALVGGYALAVAAMAWLPTRRSDRVASWALVISATWVSLSVASFYLFLPYLRNMTGVAAFLGSIFLIPTVAGCGLSWVEYRSGWRRKLSATVVVVVLVALPISMVWTGWPFRLGQALSAPALERLALRIEAGEAFDGPEWAGLYRITAAGRMFDGPDLGLYVVSDRSGFSAFIRRAVPNSPGNHDRGQPFPRVAGVSGRWSFYDED